MISATQPLFDAIRQRLIRAAMLRYRQEEGCELLLQAELLQALHTLSLHFRAGTQRREVRYSTKVMSTSRRNSLDRWASDM